MALEPIEQIAGFIDEGRRFAVTSHARPDGDALGSALGLALAMRQLGKSALVISADPPPHAYRALPAAESIRVARALEGDYDGVFVLECNSLARPEIEGLDRHPVVNIDHHPGNQSFGQLNWNDPQAAAVGELVFQLVERMGVALTPQISSNLYVAILTDTGSFQFSNTRAETFRIAGRLVEGGADPGEVARTVYMQQPLSKVRLLSKVLETMVIHPSGRIAYVTATHEMARRVEADLSETEGIVNHPLSIDGVSLVAFFRQDGKDRYRVSLRSKNHHDVGGVARRFGGGGHSKAAGLTIEASHGEAVRRVILELEALLDDPSS